MRVLTIIAVGRRTVMMLIVVTVRRWPLVMLALVIVGMFVVSLVIPIRVMIPIRMLLAPFAVALFRMTIAVTEIRMVLGVIVTILIAIGAAQARSEQEKGSKGQRRG